MVNECQHYLSRVKGCRLHTRCTQQDKVSMGEAARIEDCADFKAFPLPILAPARRPLVDCEHFGEPTGNQVVCQSCKGSVLLNTFHCARYGECTPGKQVPGIACCAGNVSLGGRVVECPGKSPRRRSNVPRLNWSYGVTTVPQRKDNLLQTTLDSLKRAGFDAPRLFVDGARDGYEKFGLEVTYRWPILKTHGNWILSIYELFIREPNAQRFAIFQDDIILCANTRAYLDSCPYPPKSYLNLYTFPANLELAPPGEPGRGRWYEAVSLPDGCGQVYHGRMQQRGLGAVALVFDRDAVLTILQAQHMVERPMAIATYPKKVDGGIVESMNKAGFREWVHSPSLVQHVGDVSSMGNNPHPKAPNFPGEGFDALALSQG